MPNKLGLTKFEVIVVKFQGQLMGLGKIEDLHFEEQSTCMQE